MQREDGSRPAWAMARLVDDGLALIESRGCEWVSAHLAAHGVPSAVIDRVQRGPERRRASSGPAAGGAARRH